MLCSTDMVRVLTRARLPRAHQATSGDCRNLEGRAVGSSGAIGGPNLWCQQPEKAQNFCQQGGANSTCGARSRSAGWFRLRTPAFVVYFALLTAARAPTMALSRYTSAPTIVPAFCASRCPARLPLNASRYYFYLQRAVAFLHPFFSPLGQCLFARPLRQSRVSGSVL